MSQSRLALTFSILYSLPLLAWFTASLEFLEWNTANLHLLFQQTLAVLVLLQALTMALLFINHPQQTWRDELVATIHILLFPLPFFMLIYLSSSVSLTVLFKTLVLPGSVAIAIVIIQQCRSLFPARRNILQQAASLFFILLAVLVWNYRKQWWAWSGL